MHQIINFFSINYVLYVLPEKEIQRSKDFREAKEPLGFPNGWISMKLTTDSMFAGQQMEPTLKLTKVPKKFFFPCTFSLQNE
jgi:hypothetical protein